MKARILVIEDEMAINDLLCMNLEAAGYETVGYLDGNDASEGVVQDHEFQCAYVIDADACLDCGTCADACPTEAIHPAE